MARGGEGFHKLAVRFLVVGIALFVVVQMRVGVMVHDTAAFVALVVILALLNAFVRPILLVLTLPLTVATLGLFIVLLNAFLLAFAAWLLPGVAVTGFLGACAAALIVSVISVLLNAQLR